MKWKQTGRTVRANGETTIEYQAQGTDVRIQSRKKAIPHANGLGTWMHTSYFVIRPDRSEREYWTLRDAKAAAEA